MDEENKLVESTEQEKEQEKEEEKEPETEKPKSNWFRNIMSVDETRISALIVCMIASLAFGGYIYLTTNEISAVWADIVETLIFCITGINISQVFTGNSGEGGKGKLGATLQNFLGGNKPNNNK